MTFVPNQIYHVYNQGNNRDKIFFQDRNYQFFLKKMEIHLAPYAEILAYCLMPNHFHWLIYTKPEGCELSNAVKPIPKMISSVVEEPGYDPENYFQQNLSHSIKTILSSYTRAVNKQEGRSGSLFRAKTKAKDGWIGAEIKVGEEGDELLFRANNQYANTCLQYIHNNPVKAELSRRTTDWEYSSARDFAGLRRSSILNQNMAKALLSA
ncbi:MAG: transposase [Bacteroidia bacterium]